MRTINSVDPSEQASQAGVNSTTFTFRRISVQKNLPLISTLAIDSVGLGLNGTMVQCSELGTNGSIEVVSTLILFIQLNFNESKPIKNLQSDWANGIQDPV